jgi:hypothetical protein
MSKSSAVESTTAASARALALRVSRRSFLGRLGRLTVVMAAASAGVNILDDRASALQCDQCLPGGNTGCGSGRTPSNGPCSGARSVTCGALTGTGGRCPDNSFACGSWSCSCSACASGVKRWTDCCGTGQCSASSSCRCATDSDGYTRKTCCVRKFYAGGNGGGSGTCNAFIYCRFGKCV